MKLSQSLRKNRLWTSTSSGGAGYEEDGSFTEGARKEGRARIQMLKQRLKQLQQKADVRSKALKNQFSDLDGLFAVAADEQTDGEKEKKVESLQSLDRSIKLQSAGASPHAETKSRRESGQIDSLNDPLFETKMPDTAPQRLELLLQMSPSLAASHLASSVLRPDTSIHSSVRTMAKQRLTERRKTVIDPAPSVTPSASSKNLRQPAPVNVTRQKKVKEGRTVLEVEPSLDAPPPLDIQLRVVVELVLASMKLPSWRRQQYQELCTRALSLEILTDLFWYIYCKNFRPNGPLEAHLSASFSQRFLVLRESLTVMRPLDMYTLKHNEKDNFLTCYAFIAASVVLSAMRSAFPGSSRHFDGEFLQSLDDDISMMLGGMRLCRATLRSLRQKWFGSSAVGDSLGRDSPEVSRPSERTLNGSKSESALTQRSVVEADRLATPGIDAFLSGHGLTGPSEDSAITDESEEDGQSELPWQKARNGEAKRKKDMKRYRRMRPTKTKFNTNGITPLLERSLEVARSNAFWKLRRPVGHSMPDDASWLGGETTFMPYLDSARHRELDNLTKSCERLLIEPLARVLVKGKTPNQMVRDPSRLHQYLDSRAFSSTPDIGVRRDTGPTQEDENAEDKEDIEDSPSPAPPPLLQRAVSLQTLRMDSPPSEHAPVKKGDMGTSIKRSQSNRTLTGSRITSKMSPDLLSHSREIQPAVAGTTMVMNGKDELSLLQEGARRARAWKREKPSNVSWHDGVDSLESRGT